MGSPILKLGIKMSLQLRQWEGHFGTVQNELFFRARYWNGHFEWIDNRMKSRRSKKRVPKVTASCFRTMGAYPPTL